MVTKTSKSKSKRLSQSQRKHIRRLKQAARKSGIAYTPSRAVGVKPLASEM